MSEGVFPSYDAGPVMDVNYVRAGKVLQWWRRNRKIPIDVLARRAQVHIEVGAEVPHLTPGYVIRYERGRLPPHREHLEALEKVLRAEDALLDIFGYETDNSRVRGRV